MGVDSIASSAAMMQAAQLHENISAKLMKAAGNQQQQLTNILDQSVQAGAKASGVRSNYGFSTYA